MIDIFSILHLPKNIAGDISLLLLFVVISLVFGFIFGRWKLINILINVYIAIAFMSVFPAQFFAFSAYGKAVVFLLLLVTLSFVDKRLFDLHISSAGTDFFWRLFVTSILVAGMVVSATLSFLPKGVALDLISSVVYEYFASPLAVIFWMIVPLLSLLFINNRLK
ncbi:MAG: hypothetical protein HYV45_00985 [Candidatus Moranbacteria bacterium]|nr:hypothetical protein [Candidatus Moranbacteria bacterium]